MFIKLLSGSITISDEGLKGLTRKSLAHLSDEDFEIVQKVKDERFPPVVKEPKDTKPSK